MYPEDHVENSSIHREYSENLSENNETSFPSQIQLNDVSKSVTAYSLNPSTFTQKLYVMLQDENLKDVIYWNEETKDSFFIIPNEKFIQVLSIFFKHCNTSSFVRQLNMYSFHKISGDTNNIWEFKHAESLFQKGDIESLYKVKRRSTSSKSGSINPKKIPTQRGSYDSNALKRKSLENASEINNQRRINSMPGSIPFNQQEHNPENKHMNEYYTKINEKLQHGEISDADSAEKQHILINSAAGNGHTLRLDQRSQRGSLNNKAVDLHQCMLDELNAMNSSLQSICDLVEYSHDQMKNKPGGLASTENDMYRQVFGKLFQDLNQKQYMLKQHFDMQFGPTNIPVYQPQIPNPYQSFTPASPYGSFSKNNPTKKRKSTNPEQSSMHRIPYQPVSNVPLQNAVPAPQMMMDSSKDMSKPVMVFYNPPTPMNASMPISRNNSIQPMVYADQMLGFTPQPQFRDVKYSSVIPPVIPPRYVAPTKPPSLAGYTMDPKMKMLPNLKDVVGTKNLAGQENSTTLLGGVVKNMVSEGHPAS